MTTTAQQILEAAYVRSTANDPGKLALDQELWEELNRRFQRFYALYAAANEDACLSAVTRTFAGVPATVTLPVDVIDVVRIEGAAGQKVNVMKAREKDRTWHVAPAVYRQGTTLVSRGAAGDPGAGYVLTLFVLDAPAAIAALTDALDARFPVRFHDLLILDLAVYLAIKDTERDAQEYQRLRAERQDAYQQFLALAGVANTAAESPHATSAARAAARE